MVSLFAVHPRGHGEHLSHASDLVIVGGSSPWARGTQTDFKDIVIHFRFIPVGTGNTHFSNSFNSASAVHPRGHGEHYKAS